MIAFCTFSVCQCAALAITFFGFAIFVVEGFNILRIQIGSIYVSEFSGTVAGWTEAVPAEPSWRKQNDSSDTAALMVPMSTEQWKCELQAQNLCPAAGTSGQGEVVFIEP